MKKKRLWEQNEWRPLTLILATHATPAVSVMSVLAVNRVKIPARNVEGR